MHLVEVQNRTVGGHKKVERGSERSGQGEWRASSCADEEKEGRCAHGIASVGSRSSADGRWRPDVMTTSAVLSLQLHR